MATVKYKPQATYKPLVNGDCFKGFLIQHIPENPINARWEGFGGDLAPLLKAPTSEALSRMIINYRRHN